VLAYARPVIISSATAMGEYIGMRRRMMVTMKSADVMAPVSIAITIN
jgi:hypothetical protein